MHLYFIDLVRVFSCISVVFIHSSLSPFALYGVISHKSWFIATTLANMARYATPLFIMISGFIFLNSDKPNHFSAFYSNRAKRIFIPLVTWNIVYYLVDTLLTLKPLTFTDFLTKFLNGGTYYQLYFLFLITGLYAVTPVLKKYIIEKKRNLNVIVPFLILFSFVYYSISVWAGWPSLTNSFTLFVLYLGYYLSGRWVSEWDLKRTWLLPAISVALLFLGALTINYLVPLYGITAKSTFLAHRLSVFVAIPALLIFYLFKGITNKQMAKYHLIKLLLFSDLSFGVYLIHPLYIRFFTDFKYFSDFLSSHPMKWVALTFPSVLILSTASVWFIRKIPLLQKIV